MEITKESWDAVMKGQMRDFYRIEEYKVRLAMMAKQVEKLSWLLEKGHEWYIKPEYGFSLEELESMWDERGLYAP